MMENLNQGSGQDPAAGPVISIRQVLDGPPHEGDLGKGLVLLTNRGDIPAILHEATEAHLGVIWVCGARGGFAGPAKGLYAQLAERFKSEGITSLRLNYRQPNDFPECVLDLLAGIDYLKSAGYAPVLLVGHSFGGAVVIAAGAVSPHVRGVVSLSPQTYGARLAGLLSPRPLLVVHGKSDTRLPYTCGVQIYDWAREPKQLALYDGAEHRLEECREELESLLGQWIPATLAHTDERRKMENERW
jgi:alpha/beta superfamily hydrolase